MYPENQNSSPEGAQLRWGNLEESFIDQLYSYIMNESDMMERDRMEFEVAVTSYNFKTFEQFVCSILNIPYCDREELRRKLLPYIKGRLNKHNKDEIDVHLSHCQVCSDWLRNLRKLIGRCRFVHDKGGNLLKGKLPAS